MKLSFSLNKSKASTPSAPAKAPAVFLSGDDDEPSSDKTSSLKKPLAYNKKVDETVYEYDEIWDKMQEAKQRQKEAKEIDSKERKPKYIHGLLEKMMQREREAEGDEFKDKDAFHEATVAATQKPVIGPQGSAPNLTITKPADFTQLSDLELAKSARAQGKEVELNDDNQIVDKRELLTAGLNLSLPNTRRLSASDHVVNANQTAESVLVHRAVGSAASRKEINQRRAREIQQQLESEQERLASEKAKLEEEAIRRTVAKRNNESDVQSAQARIGDRLPSDNIARD
ncbi:hypothetical protein BDQ17DRAFT_1341627 [Cyathus striatus]|nr:hypothetical protein BDQ17DRAFT_1341627 [Cyathus striatus]